jgi:lipopolysaccharide export system permease protein
VLCDADYTFAERLFADKAQWQTDHWVFFRVQRTVGTSDGGIALERIGSMVGPLDKSPQDLQKGEQIAKQMNLVQLGEYVDQIIQEGQSPQRYLVDWHAKLAFPLVCVIMAALSVPFAVKINPRGGGIALGLTLSLAVAFGYWLANTMFIALGHGGYIPPVAAAWGANVIFGLTATILLLQAGT